ncbi:hypothetical protein ACJIZ3_005132 [Penstemon smallii]|uniref:ABC transporter domain-containing protein n=1 Tax=Penstemon smallii TaxID=265156 RepID=A0ABD3S458_9LAMI
MFWNQANALFRKNLSYHKRHVRSNLRIVLFPIVVFTLIGIAMHYFKKNTAPKDYVPSYQTEEAPALLQVPYSIYRVVRSKSMSSTDFPDASCRKRKDSCPATILITGENRTFGEGVAKAMLISPPHNNSNGLVGTSIGTDTQFVRYGGHKYQVQSNCLNSSPPSMNDYISCVEGLPLWRMSYSEINNELYKGYKNGNPEGMINEIMGAYDFQNSSTKGFNVNIGYNSTYRVSSPDQELNPYMVRVQKAENMITNGFLQFLRGPSTKMILESVSETPILNFSNPSDLEDPMVILFVWMIHQLFPVFLQSLVYEKQQKLRMMMAMHGLGNEAYWMIMYLYFLVISIVYICAYLVAGTLAGLPIFIKNSVSVQFIFYFVFLNLQISMSFLLSPLFKRANGASVFGVFMVFGTGLLGAFLFNSWVQDPSINRICIMALEVYPGFALYRGIEELKDYGKGANMARTFGIQWRHLKDDTSAMREVLIIMTFTWLIFVLIAYCVDNISSLRSRLSFLVKSRMNTSSSSNSDMEPNMFVQMEKEDITLERKKVEQLQNGPNSLYSVICYDLKKIYPGRDGNPDKYAVKGAHLALSRGECFGMLGPNGAGKTTFISMMNGLLEPTSGTASIEGLDLRNQMHMIHTIMGVCPQYDLIWDTLTGREHLRFYGRLKNLSGSSLKKAVDDSLRGVDLLQDGNKFAGKYSGGMKRRLSVAIALIGNPKIVYLDEPSTGLDPASKNKLWEVILEAKKDRTIILTTHSMEEAERLCDRIGIFADGGFQCLGSSDELKSRYGGSYILTITTTPEIIEEVQGVIEGLCPGATRRYCLSGTQKFELPKTNIKKSEIFGAVKLAKKRFPIQTWGVTETTLEDVFIKVAVEADSSIV